LIATPESPGRRAWPALARPIRACAGRQPGRARALRPAPRVQLSSASCSPSSPPSSHSMFVSATAMSLTLKSRATTSARAISGSGICYSLCTGGPHRNSQIQTRPWAGRGSVNECVAAKKGSTRSSSLLVRHTSRLDGLDFGDLGHGHVPPAVVVRHSLVAVDLDREHHGRVLGVRGLEPCAELVDAPTPNHF